MLLALHPWAAAAPYLVKDINPEANSDPAELNELDGMLVFVACDASVYDEDQHAVPSNCELWRSDGTADGTRPVADINPGPAGSDPRGLIVMNETLFFRACEPTAGCELWRSDGTDEGTSRVKDINPGPGDSLQFNPELTPLNGSVLFHACEPIAGCELWKSDGTAAGTVRVADINPGTDDSFQDVYKGRTIIGSTLFFVAREPNGGVELWKSDGTPAGTMMVADINPGGGDSTPGELTNVNGTLFFTAWPAGFVPDGKELWKSDGTSAGTALVAAPPDGPWDLHDLTAVDGVVFFSGWKDTAYELWRSDGSPSGTFRVGDLTGTPFASVGGRLIMLSDGLWVSDGTPEGTYPIFSYPVHAVVLIEQTLFIVTPESQLVMSDGTQTIHLASLDGLGVVWESGTPRFAGGMFFFPASTSGQGNELWALPPCNDCTPASTTTTTTTVNTTSTSVTVTTTTTTTTPATAITTTTLPEGGRCRNALAGLEVVQCFLGEAAVPPPACAGQQFPPPIRRRVNQARRLIDRAAAGGPRAKRLATKALRVLTTVTKLAATARERRLSAGCVDDLAATLRDARTATEGWLAKPPLPG